MVLRAPSPSSVVWPGHFLELDLPDRIPPDSILAIEPRRDCSKSTGDRPPLSIVEAVARKIRIPNETHQPKRIPDMTIFVRSYLPTPQILVQTTPQFPDP